MSKTNYNSVIFDNIKNDYLIYKKRRDLEGGIPFDEICTTAIRKKMECRSAVQCS